MRSIVVQSDFDVSTHLLFKKGYKNGHVYPLTRIEPLLTSQPLTPGAEVVSIPYGPFTTAPHSMRPQEILQDIAKPCTNCFITAMHATLQDMNGTEIFTDTGMWLHHMIWFNRGKTDLVCPHMKGERFFGGGNERWTRRWNSLAEWGYEIRESDVWDAVVELMNDANEEMTTQVVVRYEVISASSPLGKKYRDIVAVWLDLTGCGDADMDVKSTTEPFNYRTPDWVSPINGLMVDVAGHMHDGGLNMTGYQNGKVMCESPVLYDNQAHKQHIVGSGVCKDAGRVRKGDILWADAKYDPIAHPLVMHKEHPDPVMGSFGVYIGLD